MKSKYQIREHRKNNVTAAIEAVEAIVNDTDLSYEEAIEDLAEVVGHAKSAIEAFRCDIKNRDKS